MIYVGLSILLAITFFFVVDQVSRETLLLLLLTILYFEFSFSIIRSPLARYTRQISSSILLIFLTIILMAGEVLTE